MLPSPVSYPSRRQFQTSRYDYRERKVRDILLTRARVTNLGLLLLVCFAAFSLLLNFSYYLSSSNILSSDYAQPGGILTTLQRDGALETLTHLIIVPGHAIWKGNSAEQRLNDDQWILEPYQRGGGRISAFIDHISSGAELAVADEHSLLIFSGGQTRRASTTSEAESYMRLALASDLLPMSKSLSPHSRSFLRSTTEEYALDSFQNFLFSIARFHEFTGRYPEDITVVGYEMKRKRFTELHRAALRWPLSRFHYIGIDVEGGERAVAQQGEMKNGYMPYTLDTYGCHDLLLSKRRSRNPFVRYHPYYTSSPELVSLLNWCPGPTEGGKTALFKGPLPWDRLR